ncbi:BlaI/MecI/CopY family transcriptional regulator [Brevibacterium daeguense]|uniref:BlaI/MecI/CopY family transcriptional regulator n=1 Tax=Brevibacterium daeguense TaxID=909936 RepID=A0ABP8EGF4_9MICO|nr:BlaI/MecI/CopY family transcriptional regulator [Brevibacterium daeguense]
MSAAEANRHTGPVRLGALEAQVMDVLWDDGASTIREIINRLGGAPAYTTIATVLTNLTRKDLVDSTREGRSVRYFPRISREQHAAVLMEQALEASRDRAASILHFVDGMPTEDVALLREYLREHDSGGDR